MRSFKEDNNNPWKIENKEDNEIITSVTYGLKKRN